MIGGTVIETVDVPDPGVEDDPDSARYGEPRTPRVWVNVQSQHDRRECAVFVERSDAARSISPGDGLWWQGAQAFWTPRLRPFTDYPLRRIGCSGVPRPTLTTSADA